jgi:hypothetical protein
LEPDGGKRRTALATLWQQGHLTRLNDKERHQDRFPFSRAEKIGTLEAGHLRQRAADVGEDGVDGRGYVLHPADGSERNHGDEQGVFNKILTLFAFHQATDLQIQVCKQHFQLSFLRFQGFRHSSY